MAKLDQKADARDAEHYARNIVALYLDAPEATQRAGAVWYALESERMQTLSARWSIPLANIACAAAAISPGMRWEWVPAYLEALRQNPDAKVPTYSREFALRAVRCMSGRENPWTVISGPKVTAFAQLLANPFDSVPVVIDGHAWNICRQERHGIRGNVPAAARVTARRYRVAREAYYRAAHELDLYPHQVQAATWIHWRDAWGVAPAADREPGEEG